MTLLIRLTNFFKEVKAARREEPIREDWIKGTRVE